MDKPPTASRGDEPITPCPHCKRIFPCGVMPKRGVEDDILDRIKDFQSRLWEKQQKDSLDSIAGDIIKEVINLRIKVSGLRIPGAKPTYFIPPDVCPHCNKRIPYNSLNRRNQRDILDRIKDLQERLKDKKSKDPAYAILEDAHGEIGRLRSEIGALSEKA